MKLEFLGATRSVTGSCFFMESNGINLLLDCGMFHGSKELQIRNFAPSPFNSKEIDIIILSHAHIDHIGLIPKVIKEGFSGKIITTQGTAELARIILLDSAHIQEKDIEWQNRKNIRAGKELIQPIYTSQEAIDCLDYFQGVNYDEFVEISDDIKIRFRDAGHILGSAIIEVWAEGKKIVYSGDLGHKSNPIIRDPEYIEEADILLIESTYGNRTHKSFSETLNELVNTVNTTFKNHGNLLIPSFALGRTQDVLYVLNQLSREGRIDPPYVYVDSPLAQQATEIFLKHPEYYDEETKLLISEGKTPIRSSKLHFIDTPEESMQLNNIKSGAIIIAGSGMCEGGRIRHHLKHNIWRGECSVVFVGFQAQGTLGRRIVDGAKIVKLFGEDIAVKCGVVTLGGFSAHAGQAELVDWLEHFRKVPDKVYVIHGEEKTAEAFALLLREKLSLNALVPRMGDKLTI